MHAGVALVSFAAAWLVAHDRARSGILLVAAGACAAYVLRRRDNGVYAGTALIVLIPYQTTLLLHQTSIPRVAVLIGAAGFVASAAGVERSGVQRGNRATVADLAAAAYLLFAFISWFLTPHVRSSLQATINAMLPLAFYAYGRGLASRSTRSLAWVLTSSGAAVAMTVLFEYFIAHRPLFIDPTTYLWNAKGGLIFRPGGVFGSPPAAATVLAMTALIAFGLYSEARGIRRQLLVMMVALTVGGLFVTFTRAGLIAFAVGALAYVALVRPSVLPRAALGAMVATVAFAFVLMPRIANASWYQEGILRQGDLSARQSYWRQALPLITNSSTHLFVGHGINSLVIGRPELPGPPNADLAAAPTLLQIGPHNQYVRTLFEEGFVGLSILVTWLVAAIGAAVAVARNGRLDSGRQQSAACAAALIAFMVASSAGDSLRNPPTFAVAALIAGMAVTARQRGRWGDAR